MENSVTISLKYYNELKERLNEKIKQNEELINSFAIKTNEKVITKFDLSINKEVICFKEKDNLIDHINILSEELVNYKIENVALRNRKWYELLFKI